MAGGPHVHFALALGMVVDEEMLLMTLGSCADEDGEIHTAPVY